MAKASVQRNGAKTQSFYDRIADVHNLALRVNGYRSSVAKYLRSLDLRIDSESYVLDAGSGTGIVTLGFADSGYGPKKTIAFDLSRKSLQIAAEQFEKEERIDTEMMAPVQGNILELPFADDTFQVVLSCGVLEYVSLDDGLRELARVTRPGGRLVLIPVKPSLVGSVLEFLYKFKAHPEKDVRRISQRYFKIVGDHEFPLKEPIAWSKKIFLLEKPIPSKA
jgi:demethylmenaquinone methyltransferase/2-methoxy-6-polyprenyl-1,4-benzoquinol methylase